ncbi:MAG TPA: serine hydrolase domain-containing protein [Polyangiales bacterium]|nr:serine hydrolase domain-containing protein [Polyangiales bacterium]
MLHRWFSIVWLASLAFGCAATTPHPSAATPEIPEAEPPSAASAVPTRFSEDTLTTSVRGTATFKVPAGWAIAVTDSVTRLIDPDGDCPAAVVDLEETDADAATRAAWNVFRSDFNWPLHAAVDTPPRDGWDAGRGYSYEVSPNAKLEVSASALRSGSRTVVLLLESPTSTLEKRLAQLQLIAESLRPAGYSLESFAGKKPNVLTVARLSKLNELIATAQRELEIPGVAVAIVQNGELIQLKGFGVRELGKPEPVDGDSLFLIGSNTKALTTLLLAQLVDEGKLRWDLPVVDALPYFRLGSEQTTKLTQIKHLVCACTGLPRQDFEWLLEYAKTTPAQVVHALADIEPTTQFGETFQYSNQLAAAAGYIAANAAYPGQELGAAYDRAMATRVFGPLGMTSTTFDFARAARANHAVGHGRDADGRMLPVRIAINDAVIPLRPAGGAWSSARDLIRYVQLELARGVLPGKAKRLVSEANLLERRAPQVAIGEHTTYGMGLEVDRRYDIPVVHHGGSLFGFKSDMIWLPEHDVGAVILTNSDSGGALLWPFQRALLEQLFDGKPEAAEDISSSARNERLLIAKQRAKLTLPADPSVIAKLAPRYAEPVLGAIEVRRLNGATLVDVGEWQSTVATRKNDDGTTSLVTIEQGLAGLPLVVGTLPDGKRTLILRDAQHEYRFVEGVAH